MGGSLAPHGGQNPIEPAKLGAAVLHGPHVHNFADVFAALDQAQGAMPVSDEDDLARRLDHLLADGVTTRAMARRAGETVDGRRDPAHHERHPAVVGATPPRGPLMQAPPSGGPSPA
jgi:3-deoxy-D-manno-octulosonic-acid transferase